MGAEGKGNVIQPRVLKGFRDYLPPEMRARQEMIRKITAVFERFGFGPLQTPALEYSEILLGKYGKDAEKLFYRFEDHGGRDICLRYDLTVPLARFVAQHKELPKPFKRYQIAPVWRAEKPGRGRFREFMQCDADIVGSDSLMYDAECIALGYSILKELGVENFEIRVSTRKMLAALGQALGVDDEGRLNLIFRTVDKLPSQGEERVRALLDSECGCTAEQILTIMDFAMIEGDNEAKLDQAWGVLGREVAAKSGAWDLVKGVLSQASLLGVPDEAIVVDFSIARGLDYYTGTVYETFLTDLPGFGSVMSGGRYDGLITQFLGKPMPAVGISVGIDRLFAGLVELGVVEAAATGVVAGVAAASADESNVKACLELTARLREAGVPCEPLFDGGERIAMKKQLKRASQRGVPFVLILGPDEIAQDAVSLKNMQTGEQETLPVDEAIAKLAAFVRK